MAPREDAGAPPADSPLQLPAVLVLDLIGEGRGSDQLGSDTGATVEYVYPRAAAAELAPLGGVMLAAASAAARLAGGGEAKRGTAARDGLARSVVLRGSPPLLCVFAAKGKRRACAVVQPWDAHARGAGADADATMAVCAALVDDAQFAAGRLDDWRLECARTHSESGSHDALNMDNAAPTSDSDVLALDAIFEALLERAFPPELRRVPAHTLGSFGGRCLMPTLDSGEAMLATVGMDARVHARPHSSAKASNALPHVPPPNETTAAAVRVALAAAERAHAADADADMLGCTLDALARRGGGDTASSR